MFYSHDLLRRPTGKFAVIWAAAMKPDTLTLRDYLSVRVPQQCHWLMDYIFTEGPVSKRLSLYLSSNLMFGVVKVHLKQVDRLFADVRLAQSRLMTSFLRSIRQGLTAIDLPKSGAKAVTTMRTPNVEKVLQLDPYFGQIVPEEPSIEAAIVFAVASPRSPLRRPASPERHLAKEEEITMKEEEAPLARVDELFPLEELPPMPEDFFETTTIPVAPPPLPAPPVTEEAEMPPPMGPPPVPETPSIAVAAEPEQPPKRVRRPRSREVTPPTSPERDERPRPKKARKISEEFELQSITSSVEAAVRRPHRARKRVRPVFDAVTRIPTEELRESMQDYYSTILPRPDIPAAGRLRPKDPKELFVTPGSCCTSSILSRHLKMRKTLEETRDPLFRPTSILLSPESPKEDWELEEQETRERIREREETTVSGISEQLSIKEVSEVAAAGRIEPLEMPPIVEEEPQQVEKELQAPEAEKMEVVPPPPPVPVISRSPPPPLVAPVPEEPVCPERVRSPKTPPLTSPPPYVSPEPTTQDLLGKIMPLLSECERKGSQLTFKMVFPPAETKRYFAAIAFRKLLTLHQEKIIKIRQAQNDILIKRWRHSK